MIQDAAVIYWFCEYTTMWQNGQFVDNVSMISRSINQLIMAVSEV